MARDYSQMCLLIAVIFALVCCSVAYCDVLVISHSRTLSLLYAVRKYKH